LNKSKYYSCNAISNFNLAIEGNILNDKCIGFCCQPLDIRPGIGLDISGEKTISKLINLIEMSRSDGRKSNKQMTMLKKCIQCEQYLQKEWESYDVIEYINLSLYPSPCQCKCIYCTYETKNHDISNNKQIVENYMMIFNAIEHAKRIGLISPNALYQISSGEITIHPLKEKFYDLIEGARTWFYTNCFKFDERIAKNLSLNPNSAINFSIDCGTSNTWRKVKGFNNFNFVIDVLKRYSYSSIYSNQLHLKYIILPSINDHKKDYSGVIELMKELDLKKIVLSCDVRNRQHKNNNIVAEILSSVEIFIDLLDKNNIEFVLQNYSESDARVIAIRHLKKRGGFGH